MHVLHECHEIKKVQEPIENLIYQEQFCVEIFQKSQKFNTWHTFKVEQCDQVKTGHSWICYIHI